MNILGLDLGVNSIGWALVDNKGHKILGAGSRVFPEGVNNLGKGDREQSKNAERTGARGVRRQLFRRRLRKRYLIRELVKSNLFPLDAKTFKKQGKKNIFLNPDVIEWFKLNPYTLRALAIHEKITLVELGRIFYHMIQRRGFQSNRKSDGEDNLKSPIFKGDASEGKIGITNTLESIEDHETLGAYLNKIYPSHKKPYTAGLERIRNRHTTRKMYIDEFDKIWDEQQKHHPELTPDLKTIIGGREKEGFEQDGVLFHQRPLRSQKHLVGHCTLEPTKTRCPISAIPFEMFRVHQWVNSIQCNDKPISCEERDQLVKKLLSTKTKVKFVALRKVIQKSDASYHFNYSDDDKVVGAHTISHLSGFFGKRWGELTKKEREDIWHILYFYEDRDKLETYAQKNWGFDLDQAKKISHFNLKTGYAALSRKAINNILPFLKEGFIYNVAVILGGIKNAFGDHWDNLGEQAKPKVTEFIQKQQNTGGFSDQLKSFLQSDFGLSPDALKKLYHHSANIHLEQDKPSKLPIGAMADKEIQNIRNPIVMTALFEVRKLINKIIDRYGKPDKIRIELARDLKNSKEKRNDIRKEQKILESENDRVKKELAGYNERPTHESMLKFKLWEECNKTCPYTGKCICVTKLFGGEVQIEHIMPYSRSLNDSFMNKTLCFTKENAAKGNKTPYEYYSSLGKEKWEWVKQNASACFKNKDHYPNCKGKYRHFIKKELNEDFISRQLNDTRYISRATKDYVTKILDEKHVESVTGQFTANIRHKWGLNNILGPDGKKNRDDHRHHAVDALTIACTTRGQLQKLSEWNRYDRSFELSEFPKPWDTFWEDASTSISQILVSHKRRNALLTTRMVKTKKDGVVYKNKSLEARGALHKESVYGKRKAPQTEEAYHMRKPIESLIKANQIEKIVDPTIRALILNRVDELGGFEGKEQKVPKGAFFKTDEHGVPQPLLFLPNKKGMPVCIKKVRMKAHFGNSEQLKGNNQHVDLQNNHHVLIYKKENGDTAEDVITFWVAVARKQQRQPVFQLPPEAHNGEIVATLQINDMFLLGLHDPIDWENPDYKAMSDYLYRVQKLSSQYYTFRKHNASRLDELENECRISSVKKWSEYNPVKVTIASDGRLALAEFGKRYR